LTNLTDLRIFKSTGSKNIGYHSTDKYFGKPKIEAATKNTRMQAMRGRECQRGHQIVNLF